MFGLNEIKGPAFFKDAPEDSLKVTSRFLTIQGEGPFASRPAFFIRLTHCSLACSWCDAFFDEGDWMTFDEIEADIEKQIEAYFTETKTEYSGGGYGMPDREHTYTVTEVPDYAKHTSELVTWPSGVSKLMPRKKKDMVLVITGGEPTLQKNLIPFLERMNKIFRNTQIESNGTHFLDFPNETTLVVSPKCNEHDGKPTKYLTPRPEVLERADVLKFVVSADPTSPYHTIPEWAYEWKKQTGRDIYISPMNEYRELPQKAKAIRDGRNRIDIEDRSTADEVVSWWEPGLFDMEKNQKNHEYAGKLVIKHGFILNLQQHLYISVA